MTAGGATIAASDKELIGSKSNNVQELGMGIIVTLLATPRGRC